MKYKLKRIIIIKRCILMLVIIYIFTSIYLTLKISYYMYESYHGKPYYENSFISEELYPFYYSRRYNRDNYIIDKDAEQYTSYYSYTIIYPNNSATFYRRYSYETYYKEIADDGSIAEEERLYGAYDVVLYVELKFESFHWVVENMYEDP